MLRLVVTCHDLHCLSCSLIYCILFFNSKNNDNLAMVTNYCCVIQKTFISWDSTVIVIKKLIKILSNFRTVC